MADEDEIVVNLEGDGADEVVVHNDDAVAELKRQYEALEADNKKRADAEAAAHRRAADAERSAAAARNEAAAAHSRIAESEGDAIASGINAAQAEASSAEADYAAFMERGDFAGAAKAQRRIAAAEAKIVRLDEAKADLETRKAAPRNDDPPARTGGDPFEDHLTKFTPRTADWMRSHRDWVTDPRKSAKLQGAHSFAVSEGLTPDTDEYFEYVEKTLGLREPPAARNGSGNGQRTTQRRSAPPVAPVNGSAGGHSSGAGDNRGNQVYLTKGEAASATDGTLVWNYDDPSGKGKFKKGDPIGIQEMARRKLDGQKRGLYNKNAIEA